MSFLEDAWYKNAEWLKYLKPLSKLYQSVSERRRKQYTSGKKRAYKASIPVIVVGNITVGGTGKTPLIIYLSQLLQQAGYKPGVVSRGYRSKAPAYPFVVKPNSKALESGDEALLIARATECPVVIDANRVKALKVLEHNFDCDVVLSDDGLQHYAMARDIEIAVVDASRGFGNECFLPQGPLREKPERLKHVDYLICNGSGDLTLPAKSITMELKSRYLYNLKTGEKRSMEKMEEDNAGNKPQKVHALAGIGNPTRFFTSLCGCGFDIITHIFKDHHAFTKNDINFDDDLEVVMTEKDAIKCTDFADEKHWYLKVAATLEEGFMENFLLQLQRIKKG